VASYTFLIQRSALREEVVHVVLGYYALTERVGTIFSSAHHLNHFSVVLGSATLQGCYCFLCHGILLFDLSVRSHALQDRIVFLKLQTIWSVFLVLGCDVAGSTGHTTSFMLCALQDHLNTVSFLCHFSVPVY